MEYLNKIQPHRIEKIIKLTNDKKFVTVDYLCKQTNASPSTIRRDLSYLEKNGIIKRFHGGASAQRQNHTYIPFDEREKLNTEEKEIIAREAVKLLKDNNTVVLDTGSTVLRVAFNLVNTNIDNLTIITPSIYTAQYLIEKTKFKIMISGGLIDREYNNLLGTLTLDTFNKLKADMVIMSCETVSSDMEIMYPTLEIVQVRKAVVNSAEFKVLLVNSSKFGKLSLSSIGDIDIFDIVITDNKIKDKYVKKIKKRNLELIITGN
jgi:DeoR family transcriptional regulator, aga operon transcriptional repressor